jgi:hypothetical protein
MGGYQVQKLQGSLNSCSYRQEKLSACFSSFGTTFLGKTDLFKCYASHDACRLSFFGRMINLHFSRAVLLLWPASRCSDSKQIWESCFWIQDWFGFLKKGASEDY